MQKSKSIGSLALLGMIAGMMLIFHLNVVNAQMQSPQYRIDQNSIDVATEDNSTRPYTLSTIFGSLAGNEFLKQGYILRSGNDEDDSNSRLTFEISKTNFRFENLSSDKASSLDAKFSVDSNAQGYQVNASEDHPLQSSGEDIIENTKCDKELKVCFEDRSAEWNLPQSYGFGYTIQGRYSQPDFSNGRYFRPFADLNQKDKSTVIINAPRGVKTTDASIKLQIVPSQNQINQHYETVINFIALPSY